MADTLFVGGRIWTGDPARSQTDAMLVRDGRVAAFDDEALAQRGRVREYDLGGGMLMPGFNDGHCHPQMAGEELAGIPLDGVTSVDDVLARVRDYAAAHRDRAWLLGGSYLPTISPGGEFRREWLDNVVRDRPVVLNSADRHSLWLNTRALEIAGIDASTPDPSGGVIVRDADGTPTGLVQELAQELVTDRIPKKSDHDLIDELAIAVSAMADAGITWAQCAGAYLDDLRVYEQAWAARSMPLGMGIALWTDPERWREQLDPFAAAARAFRGGDGLTLNSVKFWGDGAIASADHPTAAMIEPYETDPHWHGVSMWTTEEMQEAAAAFDRAGFQLHIHGIGDAAVRRALDAIEFVRQRHGRTARRPIIAHLNLAQPEDLARLGPNDVVACMSPVWAQAFEWTRDIVLPAIGTRRESLLYPLAAVERGAGTLSFGSDWPVTSVRPIDGIATAVTRQTTEGYPAGGWIPEQRLTLDEALRAYTAGVAIQSHREHDAGSLRPGMRADLVHLGDDLFEIEPLQIANVEVVDTWIAGELRSER